MSKTQFVESQALEHYARMFDVFSSDETKAQTLDTMQQYKSHCSNDFCCGFVNGLEYAMALLKEQTQDDSLATNSDYEQQLLTLLGAASKVLPRQH